ncbi:uncharacterized protein EDB91DRAFT_742641 [Suillus paluster]|uniref:uncharacterized protein n=1 Tax=Suillus paluster TaxID=48578 RepID=UPI001B8782C4|nr:uncharacterized protein EDB91DRAFT_742641 [Suillus paluster]KAG1730831.1 hypothetical protein EDB91DRAFT_742641 [Suillus paluster]
MVSGRIGAFMQSSGCRALKYCATGYHLPSCAGCDRQLVVFDKQSQRNLETKLSFRMTRSSTSHGSEHGGDSMCSSSRQSKDFSSQQHVDVADRAVAAMISPTPKGCVQGDTNPLSVQVVTSFVDDTADAFQPLLSGITTFVKIARTFAEAHPYTKMALMVLTAGYEVIQRQLARDDSIRRLASIMCESYGLVSNAPDLCNFHGQAETVNLLARQTIECAYFIRDYAIHKSGLKHSIANVFSNIDETIQNYEAAFRNIRTALEQKAVINTQLVVFRIHDALKDLAIKVDLDTLPYATGASYHAQRIYDISLEDIHVAEISDWVNGKSSEAIYLLIGPHGSEISAVAHAAARQFDNISRLGSSYCLDRTRQGQRKPANLFSTIARDLADHDPEFMVCLRDKVKRRAIGSSPHIPTQFDFILAPAQQMTSLGPVLVVIDGLDACGDVNSRTEVVSVLKEKAKVLPPSFKFLITCLPETDVAIALRDEPHVLAKELDAVVTVQPRDNGLTTVRTKPRPLTPPIQTELSQSDYFSFCGSASSAVSSSSISSLAPSIFDEGLRTFSPDTSSPASSVTSCTDAGSPKRFVGTFKHIETREKAISFDEAGLQTVTHTSLKQTVKQHVSSNPRRVQSYTPILDEPNACLFIPGPTAPTEDNLAVVPPRCDSPRPARRRRTPRQETIIRSEIQTTGPQSITLLSP